jgi:LysM repeat protein
MKKLSVGLLLLCLAIGGWYAYQHSLSVTLYTVVRGDSLSRIAKAHDVSVDELRAWNGIEGSLIEVGQVLELRLKAALVGVETKPQKRVKRRKVEGKKTGPRGLNMPKKKACLRGPSLDDLDGEVPGMVASAGLGMEDIRPAMNGFLPKLGRCFDDGWPTATMEFKLTVACTGQVASVGVNDAGGLPSDVVECMQKTLGFVGFPAHDLPDGVTFRYPITLSSN